MTCHVYRVYRSPWAGYLPFASSTQTLQINMGPWSVAKQDYANFHSCSSRLMVQICMVFPTLKISYTSVLAFVSSVARWNDRPAPCCSWFWSSNFQALRFIDPVTPFNERPARGQREVPKHTWRIRFAFDDFLLFCILISTIWKCRCASSPLSSLWGSQLHGHRHMRCGLQTRLFLADKEMVLTLMEMQLFRMTMESFNGVFASSSIGLETRRILAISWRE